jgi:hypothetical protein
MSRDQIEEIVQDVDKAIRANFVWDVLAGGYIVSSADNIAQELYYKGYCKSTDVTEEIFAEIEKEIELALDSNYKVKRDAQDDNDSLVMYVEGKIDCLRGLLGFIAELKKKYTEEGK